MDGVDATKLVLERLKFASQTIVSEPLDPDTYTMEFCRDLVHGAALRLTHRVYGQKAKPITHEWPATWWDGFKRAIGRRLPGWMQPGYRMISHTVTCCRLFPTLRLKGHTPYIYSEDGETCYHMPEEEGEPWTS